MKFVILVLIVFIVGSCTTGNSVSSQLTNNGNRNISSENKICPNVKFKHMECKSVDHFKHGKETERHVVNLFEISKSISGDCILTTEDSYYIRKPFRGVTVHKERDVVNLNKPFGETIESMMEGMDKDYKDYKYTGPKDGYKMNFEIVDDKTIKLYSEVGNTKGLGMLRIKQDGYVLEGDQPDFSFHCDEEKKECYMNDISKFKFEIECKQKVF